MSASQSPSPGPRQTPNNAMPAFMRRRKQEANPLRPKTRLQPRASTKPQAAASPANGAPGVNGARGPQNGVTLTSKPVPIVPTASAGEYVEYPIYTTPRQLLEGYRTHVLRFLPNSSAAIKNVDLTDESQFVRPVKLHRRDPRTNNTLRWTDGDAEPKEEDRVGHMDDKERERLEIARAERRAEREANQAQIAPVAKNTPAIKSKGFQKKTEQVFQVNDTKGKKKALQLRYEEALPWHVEDFDNKNTWAGVYESALSDCHVMLMQEEGPNGLHYRMTPLEKWYKFNPKNLFKALSIDEAEARMSKKIKDPRWFMETQKASEQRQKEEVLRQGGSKLFTRTGERGERRVKTEGAGDVDEDRPEQVADADDIDYNYEEAFADDEENALFGGDEEENKEAEEKIKREQREANIFQLKEEKDYDKEEVEEKKKAQDEKKLSKKVQKALMKREKNYVYESDSNSNPYSSESESEDSETERLKEEERKKLEEQQQGDKGKAFTTEKPLSAPSSVKGISTPPRLKQDDPIRKGILKRPGSPNLSEASGSESSRKKLKKKHGVAAPNASLGASISRPQSPSGMATPTGANAGSKPAAGLKPSAVTSFKRNNAGSGSDGEMSDASWQARKLKLRLGSTGKGSRPTSPNESRAASPAPQNKIPATLADEDIRKAIPAAGILLADLIKVLGTAVSKHPEFMTRLKANSRWDKATKILYPKI